MIDNDGCNMFAVDFITRLNTKCKKKTGRYTTAVDSALGRLGQFRPLGLGVSVPGNTKKKNKKI